PSAVLYGSRGLSRGLEAAGRPRTGSGRILDLAHQAPRRRRRPSARRRHSWWAGQRSAQLDRSRLRAEFGPMIAGFHHVDSETGYGIPELVREIAATAHEIPHVSRWYPGSWLRVRRALAERPDAYVRYSTFEAVAAEYGLPPTGARSLARNAHALGQFI